MKPWQQALLYILSGMAIAFGLLLLNQPHRGEPIQITPALPAEFTVQVDGSVKNPGLYTVLVGTRVGDVIEKAGGLTDTNAGSSLNLARPVKDGERIVVGLSETEISRSGSVSILLDLNLATEKELDSLPGIGEVRAKAIVAYRQEQGAFISVEELQQVPGITTDVYNKIKDLVMVN